jgi:hypothetical protein
MRPQRSLLSRRHLRPSLPAFNQRLLVVDAEHPVGQLGQLLKVKAQSWRVELDGGLPKALHLPGGAPSPESRKIPISSTTWISATKISVNSIRAESCCTAASSSYPATRTLA